MSTSAPSEETRTSVFIFQGNGAVLFCILEVIHHARAKDEGDEHIILRTSLLTMPIYFDNQLTIVPVQPLKGQWFIRIDQFWVTSCAALWGQTEAWLAMQSGMLSNAQAWLTAHQHAELNSLAKCFPFTLTSDTHIKLWMLLDTKIKTPHILVKLFSIHIIGQFKESQQVLHKTLNMFDETGSHRWMDTDIYLDSSKLWITFYYIEQYMPSYRRKQKQQLHSTKQDCNSHHAYLTTIMHRQQQ